MGYRTPTEPEFPEDEDDFLAPHSRHTTVDLEEVRRCPPLEVLSDSPQAGLYIAARRDPLAPR